MKSKFRVRRQDFLEILYALLLTLLITAILLMVRSEANSAVVSQLYLIPVSISAARWGLRAGITAALAAFLAFLFFFIQPYYTLAVLKTQDLVTLVVFLAVAWGISHLISQAHTSQALAEDRQREAVRLYELNNKLIELNQPEAILQALADQTLEVFQADRVEILLEKRGDLKALLVSAETSYRSVELPGKASLVIPLEIGSSLAGEARIWLALSQDKNVEERPVQAFIVRGVVALERAQAVTDAMKAQSLAESDRLKSALLSSVSHELRTPLATIKAAVSSLRGEFSLDEAARTDLLEAIELETDDLNQLVSNLLSMSRLEAGVLTLQRRWNSLKEIIESAVQHVTLGNHQFELVVPEELPLAPVDYFLMEQVFINLISNSIKYTPDHSLIQVTAQVANEDFLNVRVINQGPPVPTQMLEKIFERFSRVTSADKVSGIGLGLSICKGIVEAHNGKIWAENTVQGFTVVTCLPMNWPGERPYLPAYETLTENTSN